jgi:UDP-N-acetylmuramoylalanine--D-glutamate ligase
MRLEHLRPDALVWTNFAPDHLDWHTDMREYFEAKLRIASLLKKEVFTAGESVMNFARELKTAMPSFCEFVSEKAFEGAPSPFDNSIQSKNFAMAKALWRKLGLEENILFEAAKDFQLASHRFAKIAEIDGIGFWNDSKATNVHAAVAALRELKGKNLIWIGGGKDKGCDISGLIDSVSECAAGAALIGETADILKDKLGGLPLGVKTCKNLEDALNWAFQSSEKGGNILFSPGFSSFGMFKNYADRGKSFEKLVLCLK